MSTQQTGISAAAWVLSMFKALATEQGWVADAAVSLAPAVAVAAVWLHCLM
jgi:hypothetical protein